MIGANVKIGTTYYATLADAVSVGGIITVLDNITFAEALTIPVGKTVTIDLNGKKLDYTYEQYCKNMGIIGVWNCKKWFSQKNSSFSGRKWLFCIKIRCFK